MAIINYPYQKVINSIIIIYLSNCKEWSKFRAISNGGRPMKKEALVSAMLLVSPVSQLHAQDLTNARAQVRTQQQELIEMQFKSAKTQMTEFWEQDENGEWGPISIEHFIRISFVNVENEYSFMSHDSWEGYNGTQMEYEAIVEAVTPEGKVLNDYYGHHYVKRLDGNTFKIFDCDSTRTCHQDYLNIIFHIFDTPNGKLLKFKQSSEQGDMFVNFSKEYYQVK